MVMFIMFLIIGMLPPLDAGNLLYLISEKIKIKCSELFLSAKEVIIFIDLQPSFLVYSVARLT